MQFEANKIILMELERDHVEQEQRKTVIYTITHFIPPMSLIIEFPMSLKSVHNFILNRVVNLVDCP